MLRVRETGEGKTLIGVHRSLAENRPATANRSVLQWQPEAGVPE